MMEEFCHDVNDWAQDTVMNPSLKPPKDPCNCHSRDDDLCAAAKLGHVECLEQVAMYSVTVNFNQVSQFLKPCFFNRRMGWVLFF